MNLMLSQTEYFLVARKVVLLSTTLSIVVSESPVQFSGFSEFGEENTPNLVQIEQIPRYHPHTPKTSPSFIFEATVVCRFLGFVESLANISSKSHCPLPPVL